MDFGICPFLGWSVHEIFLIEYALAFMEYLAQVSYNRLGVACIFGEMPIFNSDTYIKMCLSISY